MPTHHSNETIERFNKYVGKPKPNGCVPFLTHRSPKGYAKFSIRGPKRWHSKNASRIAYEIANGPIPDGLLVCHTCDNRTCVNIKHLFLGTNAENSADRDQKGRLDPRDGENSATRKLTWKSVNRIRRLAERGMAHKEIANIFSISVKYVSDIACKKRWK